MFSQTHTHMALEVDDMNFEKTRARKQESAQRRQEKTGVPNTWMHS